MYLENAAAIVEPKDWCIRRYSSEDPSRVYRHSNLVTTYRDGEENERRQDPVIVWRDVVHVSGQQELWSH